MNVAHVSIEALRRRLQELEARSASHAQNLARQEAEESLLMQRLRTDYQLDTVEQADEAIQTMQAKITALQTELNQSLDRAQQSLDRM
jgi:hypothetical protein